MRKDDKLEIDYKQNKYIVNMKKTKIEDLKTFIHHKIENQNNLKSTGKLLLYGLIGNLDQIKINEQDIKNFNETSTYFRNIQNIKKTFKKQANISRKKIKKASKNNNSILFEMYITQLQAIKYIFNLQKKYNISIINNNKENRQKIHPKFIYETSQKLPKTLRNFKKNKKYIKNKNPNFKMNLIFYK